MFVRIKNRIWRELKHRKYRPDIKIEPTGGLALLGSDYGGWTFEPSNDLQGSVIISCGLGEDASFDVEFASRFAAKVIIVDPTPRSIRHFNEIQSRIGQPATQAYSKGGKQPTEAYDLSKFDKGSLILEPSALWVENTKIRFFAPPDPSGVSHSIINFQNNYAQDSPSIEVDALTLEDLFAKHQIRNVPLMKIDIEGAEIDARLSPG